MATTHLINKRTNQILARNVVSANTIFSRALGLMGKANFPLSTAFWIKPCRGGIHTFCMRFPIDLIFVSRSLCITRVFKNIKPWRIIYPSFSACLFLSQTHSVFEFKAPALNQYNLKQGDKLYVGH